MEHVLNFDEFMKDKCGGGIKENIMYEGVGEFGRKIGNCKLCLMCQGKKRKNYI